MNRKMVITLAMTHALLLPAVFTFSAEQASNQDRVKTQEQEQVYGSQLMTQQERDEYRARMRAARSVEEQEQIRSEHHERMKERAKAQNMTLPDTPPQGGGGMMMPGGKGMGPGGGGSGGGPMGPGQGGNR
jgi:hypothetical protein